MMNNVEQLTKEQAAILSAYTGFLCGPFADMAEYCERIMGQPIWTHEYPALADEIREKAKPDFLAICRRGDGMTPSEEALRRAKPRPVDDDRSPVVIVWLAMFAVCMAAAVLAWGVWM